MKRIFGINSATSLSKKFRNGYTMYDWVMRQKGFPAFCMRTLCGKDEITVDEIEFLRVKSCKIGLVIRDLSEEQTSCINGTENALKAVEAAKKLGVHQNIGVALFAEIKPEWSVNRNWVLSFAQTISLNGYIPAFIGNAHLSTYLNRQCSYYVYPQKDINYFDAIFMAIEPKFNYVTKERTSYCPSALVLEDISLWCYGTTTFDFMQVEYVYAKDDKVLENMW